MEERWIFKMCVCILVHITKQNSKIEVLLVWGLGFGVWRSEERRVGKEC